MDNKMKKFYKDKINKPDHYTCFTLDDIKSPITVLLGPNGTGKSLSLLSMISECKNRNLDYISYSTSKNDIVSASSSPFGNWDIYGISCAFHSEGERMLDSFYKWFNEKGLKSIFETYPKPLYIFIDEFDSGLSIDRIIYSVKSIMYIMKNELTRRPISLVLTSNSYELCEALVNDLTTFIWLPTKSKISFNNYKEFKDPYVDYYNNVHAIEDN